MEFAESRLYHAGDESRNIDWRVTARTGKAHTKLFSAEKERQVHLLAIGRTGFAIGKRDNPEQGARSRGPEWLALSRRAVGTERIVEGIFDGKGMVGPDGKEYPIPPNYASKSKLVEGDMLKLTITPSGAFVFKQIGPIERSRVVATLGFDATTGEFYATTDGKRWSVIKASVTYFKGEPADEVVLLVPKSTPSKWAAVENIIKKTPLI